jgi:hypothetical protein
LLGIFSTLNEFNNKSWIDKRSRLFINHFNKIWQKDYYLNTKLIEDFV